MSFIKDLSWIEVTFQDLGQPQVG